MIHKLLAAVLVSFGIIALALIGTLSSSVPVEKIQEPAQTTPPTAPVSSPTTQKPTVQIDFAKLPSGSLPSTWAYDLGNGGSDNPGWGNNEVEDYTNLASNVRIENGHLVIEAQQQNYQGYQYTSARINTSSFFTFTYGKLDVVAKLPNGIGTWPAIWLLPSQPTYASANSTDPNNWLKDGELDIMEAVGAIPNQVSSSAQSYSYNPGNNNERVGLLNVPTSTSSYHDYSIDWTPTQISFAVDGQIYHTVEKQAGDTYLEWPYNQPYYLILNLAMGGTDGGIMAKQYPPDGIDNNSGPWQFDIASISYTKYQN